MLPSIQTSIKPPQEEWEQPAQHKLRNFLGGGAGEMAAGLLNPPPAPVSSGIAE